MIEWFKEELKKHGREYDKHFIFDSGEINIINVKIAITHHESMLSLSKGFKLDYASILHGLILFNKLLIYAKHC